MKEKFLKIVLLLTFSIGGVTAQNTSIIDKEDTTLQLKMTLNKK